LFTPGNEVALETARSRNQKLDDAIRRFGPPPKPLVDDVLDGSELESRGGGGSCACNEQFGGHQFSSTFSHGDSFNFNESHALTTAELHHFFSEGFVIINNAVPVDVVDEALRHINVCLGRGAITHDVPTLVGIEGSSNSALPLMDLFNSDRGSHLPTCVQSLLGRERANLPLSCQVALKFPSSSSSIPAHGINLENLGTTWHVDGFGKGLHSPFTLLVGVCLSDQDAPWSGELAVHPGSHWGLQQNVRDQVVSGSSSFSDLDAAASGPKARPNLGPPSPILLRKGDAVLCHQKLPHQGLPNHSPNIRYQVYFRISHKDLVQHRDAWLNDLILPFEGLRAVLPGV
jgi:hypothetical protein